MLSYPSSLQGQSDFPTPVTSNLPASPNLMLAYRRRSPAETLGPQVLPPLSFTACRWPYPGSPAGAHTLCFPASTGLLPSNRGSAYIPTDSDLSLNRTLPAIIARRHVTWLHHSLYATACGFGRHPRLGKTRISVSRLGTVSGQVRPVCYHTNPPSAYTSKRVIDVATTFRLPDNGLATSYVRIETIWHLTCVTLHSRFLNQS